MPPMMNERSSIDVLVVSVVVGAQPTVEVLVQNAESLRALARHATFLATPTADVRELQEVEESQVQPH